MSTSTALLAGWFLLTAIINSIAHFATPADVDGWAERNPRVARLCALLRRFGIEPVAGIKDLYSFFAGDPPMPGISRAMGRTARDIVVRSVLAIACLTFGLHLSACAAGVQAAEAGVPIIDNALCTLATKQTNEPEWEVFVCSVIDPATGKAGPQFTVQVPAPQAKAFASVHGRADARAK